MKQAISILVIILSVLFIKCFIPSETLFSNDAPLGIHKAEYNSAPDGFTGVWKDLNWMGSNEGAFNLNISYTLLSILGPVGYSKFHALFALTFCGVSAYWFSRCLAFSQINSIILAVAAALNGNIFSNVCWGLSSRAWVFGLAFIAIGCILRAYQTNNLRYYIATGLVVGLGINEGLDIGVMFSLVIGLYMIGFLYYTKEDKPIKYISIVILLAFVVSLETFHSIYKRGILTNISQTTTSNERFKWATQWSLPKLETLRVIVPGIFGYRMDSSIEKRYWGSVGEDKELNLQRFSGAGEYAGLLVLLVFPLALYSRDFTTRFFFGVAILSLILAWGKYTPLYFDSPIFTTIRNPIKWMHVFHFSILILFAYGLNFTYKLKTNKRILVAYGVFIGMFTIVYLISTPQRIEYIAKLTGLNADDGLYNMYETARKIALYSNTEVIASAMLACVGCVLLTIEQRVIWLFFLILDLSYSNLNWIRTYNYVNKCSPNRNAIVQYMQQDTNHNARLSIFPLSINSEFTTLYNIYHGLWMQYDFPFNNIHTLEIIQDPRMLPDNLAYRKKFSNQNNLLRLWELTSTRYVLGLNGVFADVVSRELDEGRFRLIKEFGFDVYITKDNRIGTEVHTNGTFALYSFPYALPRVKFYSQWQGITNQEDILFRLTEFNPQEEVLVHGYNTKQMLSSTSSAVIKSYKPKEIKVEVESTTNGILLLNDKYDPDWKVYVDGVQEELLRCNYLMRGVHVTAGKHEVVFKFSPSTTTLYISLIAITISIILIVYENKSNTKTY